MININIMNNNNIGIIGSNGYLGNEICKQLIENEDVTINLLIRPNSKLSSFIKKIYTQHKKRVHIFYNKLNDCNIFINSCNSIIFTAFPSFDLSDISNQNEINAFIVSTKFFFEKCVFNSNLESLIYISSVACIRGNYKHKKLLDETCWQTEDVKKMYTYSYYKLILEKYFWLLNREKKNIRMVSLCPGMIIGPFLDKECKSTSIRMVKKMTNLTFLPSSIYQWIVDVRDVAKITIQSCFQKTIKGRFIVAKERIDLYDLITKIKKIKYNKSVITIKIPYFILYFKSFCDPELSFSYFWNHDRTLGSQLFTNKKSIDYFNFEYNNLDNTITEMFKSLE